MKRRTILFLTILLCAPIIATAQGYTIEHSLNNYEPLVNANLVNKSNPETNPSGSDRYSSIPIGFDFMFYDISYDSL